MVMAGAEGQQMEMVVQVRVVEMLRLEQMDILLGKEQQQGLLGQALLRRRYQTRRDGP